MVGGSQGVRKVLIYFGFNILLFFCICQRVSRARVFGTVLGNFLFNLMCVMVGNKYVSP
jgi:hypothetical protein